MAFRSATRCALHERVADYVADLQAMATDVEREYDAMAPRDLVTIVFISALRVFPDVVSAFVDTRTGSLLMDASLQDATAALERAQRERMEHDARLLDKPERVRAQRRASRKQGRSKTQTKAAKMHKRASKYRVVHSTQRRVPRSSVVRSVRSVGL